MAAEDYWVYVLCNPTGKFYIGLTADVARRLRDHNTGVSKWTRKFGPWRLVWQKGPMSLTEARKLENRLKRQRGGRGFFALTGLQSSHGHAAGVVPPGGR
jgi:predicted GIY-YIG superfamily endonuclease